MQFSTSATLDWHRGTLLTYVRQLTHVNITMNINNDLYPPIGTSHMSSKTCLMFGHHILLHMLSTFDPNMLWFAKLLQIQINKVT